jgi:nitrogen fixation NifU-like protein
MRYSEVVLEHFFNPKNVGVFDSDEKNVGRAVVGNIHNGALIFFQVKIRCDRIIAAKFKAYGNCLIIAACSYATQWLDNKTLSESKQLDSYYLIENLLIPELKMHSALLVEDVIKAAILDYESNYNRVC